MCSSHAVLLWPQETSQFTSAEAEGQAERQCLGVLCQGIGGSWLLTSTLSSFPSLATLWALSAPLPFYFLVLQLSGFVLLRFRFQHL